MLIDKTYDYFKTVTKGTTHYYISFYDVHRIRQEIEVNRIIYLTFVRFKRMERNQIRWEERNAIKTELNENVLNKNSPLSAEQTYLKNIKKALQKTIAELPHKQRRRFLLYYEFGWTLEKIAEMEGCTVMPVKRSIQRAKQKIKEVLYKPNC